MQQNRKKFFFIKNLNIKEKKGRKQRKNRFQLKHTKSFQFISTSILYKCIFVKMISLFILIIFFNYH